MVQGYSDVLQGLGRGRVILASSDQSVNFNQKLEVIGTEVCFGGQMIDLADFHLTLRLFRLFAIAKYGRCNLKEILTFVYRLQPCSTHTARFRKSARVRAVKLLSRARSLAIKHFDDGLDWFSYDHQSRTWSLYEGCELLHVHQRFHA